MQQYVGYRGIAESGAASAGKFMGSWTGCIGGRLRQGFSMATGAQLQPSDIAAGQIMMREAGGRFQASRAATIR
jgi:hypothetical protein